MAKKTKSSDVTYKINEIYGFLNDAKTKVYANVTWNDGEAKDEIRNCYEKDGELQLRKGIAISDDELETLSKLKEKKPKPVDFDDVFASASNIISKREQGMPTKDGFFVLVKKGK